LYTNYILLICEKKIKFSAGKSDFLQQGGERQCSHPLTLRILEQTRTSQIIHGKRRITADTAFRLAKFFGNSEKFWLGIQIDYDIEEIRNDLQSELERIETVII